VAVEGDRLIAAGAEAQDGFAAAKAEGIARPFIVRILREDALPSAGAGSLAQNKKDYYTDRYRPSVRQRAERFAGPPSGQGLTLRRAPEGRERWVRPGSKRGYNRLKTAATTLVSSGEAPAYPFLEITSDSVFVLDPDWRVLYINERAKAQIAGGRDLLGTNLWESFPEALGTTFQQQYRHAMHDRAAVEFEEFYAPLNAWFSVHAYPVPEGLIVLFRDTTERQQTQQALRENELRFRTLADTVPEILFTSDAEGRTVYTNLRFQEYTGLSVEEALGFGWTKLIHPDDLESTWTKWMASLATGQTYESEYRYRRHDGTYRWFVSRGTPIRDESGGIARWFGICTDIDYSKQAEAALRDSENAIRALLDAAPQGIVASDCEGCIVMFNDVAEQMFGYRREDILGHGIDVLLPTHVRERHSKHRAAYGSEHRSRIMGQNLDLMACRRDRSQFPVEVSLSYVPTKSGEMSVAFISDMTARRKAEELHRANEALLRANEELERFASEVSHDLREPLATVRSYAELALEMHRDMLPRDVVRAFTIIQDSADRMNELVSDLLGYARVGGRGRDHMQATDLETAVATAVTNLESAVHASGALVTHGPLPTLPVDHVQMVQLFQNLIGNAIKYHGAQPPRVHVTAIHEDGIWVVMVEDNGEGFSPEYAEDIFHPFQRLHGDDIPGTGIGLATCRKIVEAHGGRIWADSERGHGSVFRFTLPCETSVAQVS
jgi:PAS domain S-box-containing protein